MIQDQVREIICNTLVHLCNSGVLPASVASPLPGFAIELPKNREHGDYATNVAMLLAKSAGKPPRVIADAIVANWQDPKGIIKSASVAGPGFINLNLADFALHQVVGEILQQGSRFGCHAPNGQKVLVEFVSPNATGPLHLGHARGAFMGDAVASLLSAAGYDVTRECYINDVGNQVKTLGKSVHARYRELFGESVVLDKDAYPGAYVIDIARVLKEEDGDKWLGKPESEWLARCIEVGTRESTRNILDTLAMAGVKFDHVFLERTLYQRDLVTSVLSDFKTRDMLYDAEQSEGDEEKVRREESKASKYAHQQLGGTFLKTKQFGDEEDRIVLRKSGEPVYLLADLAYHQDKYARGFDWMIDVFGADHANHTLRLRAGMSALGLDPKKLDFVVVQIVHLLRDGQEIRFSKRSGEIYLLEDLIEEMGSDVVRFIFLMRAGNTQFDFDLDLALKASNDNPVFYVQYGHARMATLLKRAAEAGKTLDAAEGLRHLDRLILPEERNMLKIMGSFPDVVLAAAKGLEPHRILYFCQELIGEFHGYFTKYRQSERIISDDADLTQSRLALVAALKQTLYNALSLLGISAPEYMQPGQEKVDDS